MYHVAAGVRKYTQFVLSCNRSINTVLRREVKFNPLGRQHSNAKPAPQNVKMPGLQQFSPDTTLNNLYQQYNPNQGEKPLQDNETQLRNTPKKAGTKPTTPERIAAEKYFRNLAFHYDHPTAAQLYKASKHGHIRPKFFMSAGKSKIRKLYEDETSWLYRLDQMQHFGLIDLCAIAVSAEMLDLPPENEDFRLFFDRDNIATWKKALYKSFPGPLRWVLEVGPVNNEIHAHVLTDFRQVTNPKILASAGTKAVKPIRSTDDLLSKAKYLTKEQLHFPTAKYPNRKQFEYYIQAVQTFDRLPNTGDAVRIPKIGKILNAPEVYVPDRVVTPGIWEMSRIDMKSFVTGNNRKVSSATCAAYYLDCYPDALPDLFQEHLELTADAPTLTAYIDQLRLEHEVFVNLKALRKDFYTKVFDRPVSDSAYFQKPTLNRFQTYLSDRPRYYRNLNRRYDYHAYLTL